jgi:hypothetical protein
MKAITTYIFIGLIAILFFALSSCSSEKRLQRRVERHGIKESIGFVVAKYPEYFKSKDTIIHDTIIKFDTITPPQLDTVLVLSDSINFYHYRSDSLTILIDKLTGRLKMNYKPRTIYLHDTVTVAVECPQIICPDCDDLKDNTKEGSGFKWWWLIVAGTIITGFYIWSNRNVRN